MGWTRWRRAFHFVFIYVPIIELKSVVQNCSKPLNKLTDNVSFIRRRRVSVWPLMDSQGVFQPSSLHKADSLLRAKSPTPRKLQRSLVIKSTFNIMHPKHTKVNVEYLPNTIFQLYPLSMWIWGCFFLRHSASALSLDLQSGVLLAVPIPEEHAAAGQLTEEAIQAALSEARYRKSDVISCVCSHLRSLKLNNVGGNVHFLFRIYSVLKV